MVGVRVVLGLVLIGLKFLAPGDIQTVCEKRQAGPRHLVHTQSYVQKRRIRFGASLSSQLETLPVVVNRSHHNRSHHNRSHYNRSESSSNQSISTLRLPQQVASTVRIMDGNRIVDDRMVHFAQQHQRGHNDSIPVHNEIIPGHNNRMDHFGGASYAPTYSQPTMNHDHRGHNFTFHLAAGATIQPGSFQGMFGNDAAGICGSDPAVMEKLDAIQRSLDALPERILDELRRSNLG